MALWLLVWATGPILGEWSRRSKVTAGIILGFVVPYLPFHLVSLGGRIGLVSSDTALADISVGYRIGFAVASSLLAGWALRDVRSGVPARRAPVPLLFVVPFTIAIAIIVQLTLRA